MKFRFPIVIIDEDFRSENASGLGIRALAAAIEKEGMEILGVTSYGDLSQFAQQQSRASAFILSIDDEEFGAGSVEETESRNVPVGSGCPSLDPERVQFRLTGRSRNSTWGARTPLERSWPGCRIR